MIVKPLVSHLAELFLPLKQIGENKQTENQEIAVQYICKRLRNGNTKLILKFSHVSSALTHLRRQATD